MYKLKEKSSSSLDSKHPFGGCNRLLTNYKTIGQSLLAIEDLFIPYSYNTQKATKEIRERLTFVPLEVLESYLEDLLDVNSTDESLFIKKQTYKTHLLILLTCVIGAFSYYNFSAESGAVGTIIICALLTLPLLILWSLSPYGSLARRMRFAKLISSEISRRRGDGKRPKNWAGNTKDLFQDWVATISA